MSNVPSADAEYDIIFAGGGASACLTAGRLAFADPTLKILVLEAGPHTKDKAEHVMPGRYFPHLHPSTTTIQFSFGKPSDKLEGRSVIVASGRCVGGGSSVNFVMYTRASASDYDDWETVHSNPGWGSKDLIPLLKKTETYQVKPDQASHGYGGPLKVSHGGAYTNVGRLFLDLAAEYDKERPIVEDTNDLKTVNGYSRWLKWIDGETGKRSDVPHHFIYNQEDNKNLQVLDGCRVKRVIIENNRAVGIEFVNDARVRPESSQDIRSVRAKRLVVVSAGTFGSPNILERSGIGAKRILEAAGIKQIVDLPGVGENYNDHVFSCIPYLAREDAETYDLVFSGYLPEYQKHIGQWMTDGTGYMGANGIDAAIKLRPNSRELQEIGPVFRNRWQDYYANAPDKPILWMGALSGFVGDHTGLPVRKYLTTGYYLEYPVSIGRVHITSDDVYGTPDFEPGFLNEKEDVAVLNWGYKKGREYARRHPLYQGEMASGHPIFPAGSAVAPKEADGPVPISAPDLVYTPEDDAAIEKHHRKTVETTWHSLGTCAMKPRDKQGVVDSRLNVYGVQNLKVADLSIAPSNVGANTYSTALVIGEKAAVIIAEELGIKGVSSPRHTFDLPLQKQF